MDTEETSIPGQQDTDTPQEPVMVDELTEGEQPETAEFLPDRQVWANRFRYFLVGVTIVCIVGAAYLIFTRGVSSPADQISVATYTSTYTPTQTLTPTASHTPRPPTQTPTPGPTHTPLPPSQHQVKPDDTWLGLAVYYGVSLDSLLDLNGVTDSDYIQAGVNVLIPAPTYTPTPDATQLPTFEAMEAVRETCREHVIASGETLVSIAIQYEMTVNFIQTVNNITDPDLVKEGQTLCIPLVTPGPPPSPTFGPSPTPEESVLRDAPQLLYPPAEVEIPPQSQQVTLQWTVVDFLDADEYYMIEIRSLSRPDVRAARGYSKTTTWTLPATIRPDVGVIETFAWRVSVVRGEGTPDEASFRWERSGLPSDWQNFMWMGVEFDSTPVPQS